MWLCQELVPPMRRRGYGRIVLTTSGYGLRPTESVDDLVAYCVAKGGQFGLMNGLGFAAADNARELHLAGGCDANLFAAS